MSSLMRMIFKRYEEDDYAAYIHSGVGYGGTTYSTDYALSARKKHRGVGYGGIYDE